MDDPDPTPDHDRPDGGAPDPPDSVAGENGEPEPDPADASGELREQALEMERHSRQATSPTEPSATRPNPVPEAGETG